MSESSPATPRPASRPVSRYAVPDLADVPADVRDRILAVQEKSGFVPNVFLVLARRPEEFRAFFAYHDALMDRPGPLSQADREMVVVATSALNHCQYCVVAHGAILRIRAKDPLVADQVAVNHLKADITPRQRAMLDFAHRVNARSHEVWAETAMGAHSRPTHRNTPADAAQFEISAHRWLDLSEPGYGVSLLNDGRYGHSALGDTLAVSLLR